MKLSRKRIWRINKNFKWSEWLERNKDSNYLSDPPLNAQMAVDILYEYLLPEYSERDGDGWIVSMSENKEQINAVIVNELLNRYSKSYKKELKERKKQNKKPSIFKRLTRR